MERYVLANALANIDFDLLISDNVRSLRGCWGEMMEIRFSSCVVFAIIDEKESGFIRIYCNTQCEREVLLTTDNLKEKLQEAVELAKKGLLR